MRPQALTWTLLLGLQSSVASLPSRAAFSMDRAAPRSEAPPWLRTRRPLCWGRPSRSRQWSRLRAL